MAIITGKTTSGFEYEIDSRIKEDWRIVELYPELTAPDLNDQARACVKLLVILFKDKGEALKQFVADQNDGYIPASALMGIIGEILAVEPVLKK